MRHSIGATLRVVPFAAMFLGCSTMKEPDPLVKAKEEPTAPPSGLAESMGPTRALPTIWLNPGDLLSSTEGTPIRALVDNGGEPVDRRILEALSSDLELREYPSLKSVDVVVSTYNPPSVSPNADTTKSDANPGRRVAPGVQDARAFVELTPKGALATSWYVLSLRKVPAGTQVAPWSAPQPPAGVYAVRFHVGSNPVVVRAVFCDKGGKSRAIVELSENVRPLGASIGSVVSIGQPTSGRHCSYASGGPLQDSVRWIEHDCASLSVGERVRVIVNSGLVSQSGVPLATFGGQQLPIQVDVDLNSLPKSQDGCRVWRF